jgi:hypothetical protein
MINPMDFLNPISESNPRLARLKKSIAGRLSFRSSTCMYDLWRLATQLVSLGRDQEAVDVCRLVVSSVEFTGNFDIWSPVQCCCRIATFACRRLKRQEEADFFFDKAKPHLDFRRTMLPSLALLERELPEMTPAVRISAMIGELDVLVGLYEGGSRGLPTISISLDEVEREISARLELLRKQIEPLR